MKTQRINLRSFQSLKETKEESDRNSNTVEQNAVTQRDTNFLTRSNNEDTPISRTESPRYVFLAVDSLDVVSEPFSADLPITTNTEEQLVSTQTNRDPLLDSSTNDLAVSFGSSLVAGDAIPPRADSIPIEDNENLVIPQIDPIQFVVFPASLQEIPEPFPVQLPALTSIENGLLVHTHAHIDEVGATHGEI